MESGKVRKSASRKTTVWLDERKLERVRRLLGTRGVRDTLEGALDEVLAIRARRRFVERLRTMNGLDLDDDTVMAKAWR